MRAASNLISSVKGNSRRKELVRSLEETAARAVVTATVTFAVGWILKKMFEKSVAEAAEEGAKAGIEDQQNAAPPT